MWRDSGALIPIRPAYPLPEWHRCFAARHATWAIAPPAAPMLLMKRSGLGAANQYRVELGREQRPGMHYKAAKLGLVGLTQGLAPVVAEFGICISAVSWCVFSLNLGTVENNSLDVRAIGHDPERPILDQLASAIARHGPLRTLCDS